MGKATRKRTIRKPAKKAAKPNGRPAKPTAMVLSEEDKRIQRGDVRVSELELLTLQKLWHQANSMNKDFVLLQQQANQAKEKAQESLDAFAKMIEEIKEHYALKEWHAFNLSDNELGGTVLFDQKKWQELQTKAAEK
jgi:hypothetical protein